jgi:hypothetical protein
MFTTNLILFCFQTNCPSRNSTNVKSYNLAKKKSYINELEFEKINIFFTAIKIQPKGLILFYY